MNVLLALVLATALCGLLVVGLASVLRDLLRRDVRFSETPPSHLARKDNRYGIVAGAAAGAAAATPARNAASGAGSHAKVIGDRG
jgi:hypothetical protein